MNSSQYVCNQLQKLGMKQFHTSSNFGKIDLSTSPANLMRQLDICKTELNEIKLLKATTPPLAMTVSPGENLQNFGAEDPSNFDCEMIDCDQRLEAILNQICLKDLQYAANMLLRKELQSGSGIECVENQQRISLMGILTDCSVSSNLSVEQSENEEQTRTDSEIYSTLMLVPYVMYMENILRTACALIEEKNRKIKSMIYRKNPFVQLDIRLTFVPSRWFHELISVFDRAKHIGVREQYPNHVELEDLLFKKFYMAPMKSNGMTEDARPFATYALDIPYYLARFGTLFSTVQFLPAKEFEGMGTQTFTDTEILLHFSVRRCMETEYPRFLMSPATMYNDPEMYSKIIAAVVESASFLAQKFKYQSAFFLSDNNAGVMLVQDTYGTSTGSRKVLPLSIPKDVVESLRRYIMSNTLLDERKRMLMKVQPPRAPPGLDIRRQSPIGKLLNFDHMAQTDFNTYKKNVKVYNLSSFDNQLIENNELGKLPCVQRLYASLMTATFSIFHTHVKTAFNRKNNIRERVVSYLNSTIRVCQDGSRLDYAGSAEALPGLLFYSLFGMSTKAADEDVGGATSSSTDFTYVDPHTGDLKYPPITDIKNWKSKTRRNALNLFGLFLLKIKPISERGDNNLKKHGINPEYSTKLCHIKEAQIEALHSSNRVLVNSSLALYLTSLGRTLQQAAPMSLTEPECFDPVSTFFTETKRSYFRPNSFPSGHIPIEQHSQIHEELSFWHMPVLFGVRADIFDAKQNNRHGQEARAGGAFNLAALLRSAQVAEEENASDMNAAFEEMASAYKDQDYEDAQSFA